MQTQIRLRRYDYTETNAMWHVLGEFLRLADEDNVYIIGKYSYPLEMPETNELYILKKNNQILFENFWFYFEQVTSVHLHQMLDMQGRVIQNPLRIDLTDSDNTDPFGPRKALYMTVTVRNYTGPEIPDDEENEEYTKEYYFMKTAYGIFISERGFSMAQNMHLIPTTATKVMSDEEMSNLIRSAYVDDFSEEDESNENEISVTSNRSNRDNSHVPLM